MTQAGCNTWGRNVKVVAHEIGHTLSMYHFDNYPAHTDTTSWMYTITPISDAQYPSSDDEDHLVYQWGN